MIIKYPSQKWRVDINTADEIKSYLIHQGGLEDKNIKSEYEVWRIKFSDATFTYYRSGVLFCTASSAPSIKGVWEFISSRAGSRARGTSGSTYITETPMCYYRVYVKRKRNLKVV
jgi:hypothetical protein